MEKWWEAGSLSGVPKSNFSVQPFPIPVLIPVGARQRGQVLDGQEAACFLLSGALGCFVCTPLGVVGSSPREIASCGRERDG